MVPRLRLGTISRGAWEVWTILYLDVKPPVFEKNSWEQTLEIGARQGIFFNKIYHTQVSNDRGHIVYVLYTCLFFCLSVCLSVCSEL